MHTHSYKLFSFLLLTFLLVGGGFYFSPITLAQQGEDVSFTSVLIDQNFTEVSAVWVFDLDGDGLKDVIAGSNNRGVLAWYKNSGDSGFEKKQTISSAGSISDIKAADLDGDGDKDLIVSSRDQGVNWYENIDGQGTFGNKVSVSGEDTVNLALIDAENDGDVDILSASRNSNVKLWKNNGAGTFSEVGIDGISHIAFVSTADMDGDGLDDILASQFGGSPVWYRNLPGDQGFNSGGILMGHSSQYTPNVFGADLDNDDDNDVIASIDSAERVVWSENLDGSGSFNTSTQDISPQVTQYQSRGIPVDLDRDGDTDVVVSDNELGWYENDGSGNFPAENKVIDSQRAQNFKIADVDNDGDQDIVTVSVSDDSVRWYRNELPPDETPPSVDDLSFDPADDATSTRANNLSVTFGESITAASSTNGLISIYNDDTDTLVLSVDPEGSQVTGLGTQDLTLVLSEPLDDYTSYHIEISPEALTDFAGNPFPGITDSTTWNFTTGDNTVADTSGVTLMPADDAENVSPATELSLVFPEEMEILSGAEVVLRNQTGVVQNTRIPTNSGELVGDGTDTISIVPESDLDGETDYAITVASSSFADLAGNEFSGFSDQSFWNFTTQDVTPPSLDSTTPADDATGVSTSDLRPTFTFNETILLEGGEITIYNDDGTVQETFASDGQQVTGHETDTITLFPLNDFSYDSGYYIQMSPGAVADESGNTFAGIADETTFNFTTGVPSAAEAAANGDIIIDFDQEVKKGTGNVTIYNAQTGATFEVIDVTTDQVTMAGGATTSDQAIISPTDDLESEQNYYLIADEGAFLLLNDTPVPENDEDKYRVSAPDETAPAVTALRPNDGEEEVGRDRNLRVYFSEPIFTESGYITIFDDTAGSVLTDISVTNTQQVTGSGTDSLTIDPGVTFSYDHDIHVELDADLVSDESDNRFAGLEGNNDWNFTIESEPSDGSGGSGSGGSGSDDPVNEAPYITDLYPANNSSNVSTSTALSAVFSESVTAADGNLTLTNAYNDTIVADLSVTGSDIALTPQTRVLTANLPGSLATSTTYYAQLDPGIVEDDQGEVFAGMTGTTSWRFTTGDGLSDSGGSDGSGDGEDTTPPRIDSKHPRDNAEDVPPSTGISLLFREPVTRGTGSMKLFSAADDQLVEEIDIDDEAVSGGDESLSLGFALSGALDYNSRYYITLSDGLVSDLAGNSFNGFTDPTVWNFKTMSESEEDDWQSPGSSDDSSDPDTTPPGYKLLSPEDDAEGVATSTGLSLIFNEDVQRESGSIHLYAGNTGQLVESISITDDQASFFPLQRQLSFSVSSELATSSDYYVQLDEGVVSDDAGNDFAGITGSSNWNFTTTDGPQEPRPGPVIPGDSNDDGFIDYLTLAFTEPIDPGEGTISIYRTRDNNRLERTDINNPRITGFGTSLVTIEPAEQLPDSEDYYVNISPGALVAADDGEDVPEVDDEDSFEIPGTDDPSNDGNDSTSSGGPLNILAPREEVREEVVPLREEEQEEPIMCSRLLFDYLKIDNRNDRLEVLKLQSFLNLFSNIKTPIDGSFAEDTEAAVETFQVRHAEDVLIPWGYPADEPTGYVYITTLNKINEIWCGREFMISGEEAEEINEFRADRGLDPIPSDELGVDTGQEMQEATDPEDVQRIEDERVREEVREEVDTERPAGDDREDASPADDIREEVDTDSDESTPVDQREDAPAPTEEESDSIDVLQPANPSSPSLRSRNSGS